LPMSAMGSKPVSGGKRSRDCDHVGKPVRGRECKVGIEHNSNLVRWIMEFHLSVFPRKKSVPPIVLCDDYL
jgi:hypothetical protein